jgi:PAS domain S-box-containing protein
MVRIPQGSDARQQQSNERRRLKTTISKDSFSNQFADSPRSYAVPRISQEIMRKAIEACQTGMVLVDRSGVIVLVNREVERLFGYEREELIGHTVDVLLPANLRAQHVRHREAYTAQPEDCMGLGRVLSGLHKDGSMLDIEVGLNAIDSREGQLVLCAITDVRERNRRQRLKDEFVTTVSHELRTPLTSISGSIGLLCGNAAGALPNAAARMLTIANTNCRRLIRLLNDILDIEKHEAGKIVFNYTRVDARALVEEVVKANASLAEPAGLRFRLDCALATCEVCADRDRLIQVVTNLLSNPTKFSPPGGEIILVTEKSEKTVRI